MPTTKRPNVNVLSTNLEGFNGSAWLIETSGKHYVISAIDNSDSLFSSGGPETMAFASDQDGHVETFMDLAVVHSRDHEECIDALLKNLSAGN